MLNRGGNNPRTAAAALKSTSVSGGFPVLAAVRHCFDVQLYVCVCEEARLRFVGPAFIHEKPHL